MADYSLPRSKITQNSRLGFIYLFIVYIVWGSTYLAIRIGVNQSAGFPPFTFGGTRGIIAGMILILLGVLTRSRIRLTIREIGLLAVSGLLLWSVANGLVLWAEQRADSSIAALFIAMVPIWASVIEGILDRRPPTSGLIKSLLVGFAGISLLSAPILLKGVQADLFSIAALVIAGMSWATGSILQQRKSFSLAPTVNSGYLHYFGSLGFFVMIYLIQEPVANPTPQAWGAWGYLIVVGSILGFTSYTQALRLLPTSVAMTYAYVNPIIAVFLGWIVLGEPITLWKIGGACLIIIGVAGVFRERYRRSIASNL